MDKLATKRDGFLDFFKGLLILWVVHIHTVFWLGIGYIPEIVRERSLLIDVATFFFISGYLTKLSDLLSSFKKSLKQFTNLYLNYLVFSCLLLVPLTLLFIFKDKTIPDLQLAVLSMLRVDPAGELWGDIPVYGGSMWYLCVYFSILWFPPIFSSFFGSRNSRIAILIFLLLAFYVSRYLNLNQSFLFTQTNLILFYLFIYMLGVTYRQEERNVKVLYLNLSLLLNIILCFVIFFHFDQGVLKMQELKFPPSFNYLIYSLPLIHIFAIAKSSERYSNFASSNKFAALSEWCGRNVYFVYLVQGVVCSLSGFLISMTKDRLPILITYLIVLTFNVSLTLLLTLLYTEARARFLSFVEVKFGKVKVESGT